MNAWDEDIHEHWEYLNEAGYWIEPDESRSPDEAAQWASALGTSYRRVTVKTTYRRFDA